MKLIELHILQSFPVSCLNRDDVGAPKSAVFGGVNRARLSSQCLKKAVRDSARSTEFSELFKVPRFTSKRTLSVAANIASLLEEKHHVAAEKANDLAKCAAHYFGTMSSKDDSKVKTLVFLSPKEYERIADVLNTLPEASARQLSDGLSRVDRNTLKELDVDSPDITEEEDKSPESAASKDKLTAKKFTKLVSKVLRPPMRKAFEAGLPKDAIDIALFGRMVANDSTVTLEGAAMFGHALSTHKADNEIDFFSAVGDGKEEAGADMIGTLEFTSAVYYRYAALNLTMLRDKAHLQDALNADERRAVVDAFLRATILAVPSARKNSMNAHTPPAYVLGIARIQGQPMQLVNAFERPVFARGGFGLAMPSARELLLHRAELNRIFGLPEAEAVATGFLQPKADAEADREERKLLADAIPAHLSLDEFCKRLTAHVL